MLISRLRLIDIRCFEDITIDFDNPGDSKLFLGDNGNGKSTILRSIAMGICDESSAAALFRELPGEYVRRPPGLDEVPDGNVGIIELDMKDHKGNEYRIQTKIESLRTFERVTQKLKKIKGPSKLKTTQRNFPWDEVFISAYGAGLRIRGTIDYSHYLPVDAVYPLFTYSATLQQPELYIRRLIDTARNSVSGSKAKEKIEKSVTFEIQKLMADLLDLDSPDNFRLTPTGIKVDGFWGTAELLELGDGYQATITWILDLLAWWFLREKGSTSLDLESIKGIVLIDEIEQHLHPKWQRRILNQLRTKFPNIQFIVATHSPLVASSSEDIDVHILSDQEHHKIHPYGWLVEDLYTEMGLSSSRSVDVENMIARYSDLAFKKTDGKLANKEAREYAQLRSALNKMPESDPISLYSDIQGIILKLESIKKEKP